MRFEDIHGKKHKTFLGALKVDLRDAYAKKVRKVIVNAMIRDQVEGYESDPAIYEEDPAVYVASTQDELVKILDKGVKTVHLYGDQFTIPGAVDGITYIGIGNPVVRFDGKQVNANVDVQNVKFDGTEFLEDIDGFYHVFQDAPELAVRLLHKAAEEGDEAAQTLLAICYRDMFGIEGCRADCAKWLEKAAEQGYAPAEMMYGLYMMDDACGLEKFYDNIFSEGIHWLQKSAHQGYARAQVLLGACYLNGAGAILLGEDDENSGDNTEEIFSELMQAVQWIKKAAMQKNRDAQTLLGICFMEDGNALWNILGPGMVRTEARDKWVEMLGIERSNTHAMDCFRSAAEQGQPEGQALLGCCFLEGVACAKDFTMGVDWLKKATKQGCLDARELLESCQPKLVMDADTATTWRNRIADNYLERFFSDESGSWR